MKDQCPRHPSENRLDCEACEQIAQGRDADADVFDEDAWQELQDAHERHIDRSLP